MLAPCYPGVQKYKVLHPDIRQDACYSINGEEKTCVVR